VDGKMSVDTDDSGYEARRIIAICGGKGGCGASMIATNVAVFLAQIGKSVVLVDANMPESGLHVWLGTTTPKVSISDLLRGRVTSVSEALSSTRVTGLSLLAGSMDLNGGYDLSKGERKWLISMLRNIEADFVLVDLPSGLHPLTLDLFGEAEVSIVVATATPDAVEATYRLIASTYHARLLAHPDLDPVTEAVLQGLRERSGKPPTPREIIRMLEDAGSTIAEGAVQAAATFHPQVVVNMIRIKADEGLGESMIAATTRWIGIVPRLLGTVEWDENVWLSLRRGTPLLIDFPQSRACRGLERVVRRLLSQDFKTLFQPAPIPKPTDEQNLYELLEIYPGASEEEVRRAYKQVRDYFGTDGLAVSGACAEEERNAYQQLAKEAHEVLVDRSKRYQYDRETFPDGFPAEPKRFEDGRTAVTGRVVSPHDSLPRVDLREDQMVTGAFLGEIREERGIQLEDISNRAKISIGYLKAIENESFEELPAPVYVRGFVTEYARYLKIDPARAVADFMATFEAHKSKTSK
jgi:flagellar biosynthesis protein FlhG